MKPIQIDAELAKRLQEAGNEVPLVGPDGQEKGVFLSPSQYQLLRALAEESTHQEPTLEELQESLRDPRRYSMDEVLRMVEG
jgi:hypothetical protein